MRIGYCHSLAPCSEAHRNRPCLFSHCFPSSFVLLPLLFFSISSFLCSCPSHSSCWQLTSSSSRSSLLPIAFLFPMDSPPARQVLGTCCTPHTHTATNARTYTVTDTDTNEQAYDRHRDTETLRHRLHLRSVLSICQSLLSIHLSNPSVSSLSLRVCRVTRMIRGRVRGRATPSVYTTSNHTRFRCSNSSYFSVTTRPSPEYRHSCQ